MKRRVKIVVAIICAIGNSLSAQTPIGIYLSGNDLRNGKLIHSKEENCKIKLNDVFYKPYVLVKTGGSEQKIFKDSIFGYRDKQNISYRFFNKDIYTILNPGEDLLLYSKESLSITKGSPIIKKYYFSKDTGSPIWELSFSNLKTVFHDNTAFCDLLNTYFNATNDFVIHDESHRIYELNSLLLLSKQLHQLN